MPKLEHSSPVARGVYLALVSIQCFLAVSIALESCDFKSAGCKALTIGHLEIFMFYRKKT